MKISRPNTKYTHIFIMVRAGIPSPAVFLRAFNATISVRIPAASKKAAMILMIRAAAESGHTNRQMPNAKAITPLTTE